MTPELIDRYATMDAIPAPTDADEAEYYDKICDVIETMPTIESKPVRQGRWITIFPDTAKCLCCGWWQRATMYNLPDDISAFSECYRFCTSCGAKMNGGTEDVD